MAPPRRGVEALRNEVRSLGEVRDAVAIIRARRALMQATRLALIGKPEGPPVAALLRILGAERARRRVENALKGCVVGG